MSDKILKYIILGAWGLLGVLRDIIWVIGDIIWVVRDGCRFSLGGWGWLYM